MVRIIQIRKENKMGNYENGAEVPVGLGLALEQNDAMGYFCSLTKDEQKRIIDQTHSMQSTEEITGFIQSVIPKDLG
jgi:hypothetical protein